ncbi:hypothetical protein YC2023_009685 [Brassica napus]
MIGASERAETTNRDLQSRDAERLHGVDRRSGLAAEKMNPVTGQTHEEGEAWLRPTVTEEKQYTERDHPSSIEVFKCWNQFVASGVVSWSGLLLRHQRPARITQRKATSKQAVERVREAGRQGRCNSSTQQSGCPERDDEAVREFHLIQRREIATNTTFIVPLFIGGKDEKWYHESDRATRSSDEIERRARVYLLSRSRRDRATTGRSSDDGDEIEQ